MHYLRWTLKARAKVCSKGENSIIFITLFTPADVLIAWYLSKLQSSWFLCREDTCRSIKFHRIVPDHLCDIFLLFIWPDYISTLDIDFTKNDELITNFFIYHINVSFQNYTFWNIDWSSVIYLSFQITQQSQQIFILKCHRYCPPKKHFRVPIKTLLLFKYINCHTSSWKCVFYLYNK